MKSLPSKRCFLSEVSKDSIVANSLETLRLMGTVTALAPTEDATEEYPGGTNDSLDYPSDSLLQMTLDDGTAMLEMIIPSYMWTAFVEQQSSCSSSSSVSPSPNQLNSNDNGNNPPLSMLVECKVGLRQARQTIQRWYVQALWSVTDPHAEILRWMEITSSHASETASTYVSMEYGYPIRKPNPTEQEILRLISCEAKQQQQQQQQQQHQVGNHGDVGDGGVTVEELALVLQCSSKKIQELMESLQWKGQIYQNQKGFYVPL